MINRNLTDPEYILVAENMQFSDIDERDLLVNIIETLKTNESSNAATLARVAINMLMNDKGVELKDFQNYI